MKSFFLILFFVCYSVGINAQELQKKADNFRSLGLLNEASESYQKILLEDSVDSKVMYDYACVLALNNQFDLAFEFLYKSTERDTSVLPLSNPDFYFLSQESRWQEFSKREVTKVEEAFGKYNNLELAKELWQMKMYDQAFYYQLNVAKEKTNRNSVVVDAIWELKEQINRNNLQRLTEIISEFGWPKKSEVGGTAASAVFLIIQHADLLTQEKYLPLMKEAADNNEASWSSLAMLIDRIEMRSGRPTNLWFPNKTT